MLDAIEADFRQVYPDSPPPFEEGFEDSIRKLIAADIFSEKK